MGQLSGCASGGGLTEGGKNALIGVAAVALVAGLVIMSKDDDDDDRDCRKHHGHSDRRYCGDSNYGHDRYRNSRDGRW
ncbi:hypothetical protein QO207_15920 [Pseudomonas sp. CAN2814]|uniref:hypothetical protein n=1 Tax=Pseudomonas sp. CAN1 TaxID=3046726 RepID=UPI002647BEBC|nr:hypothetical protein [Pseudomonas sp. CAN1]MDN6858083.1 hypothetical protein [Pseudomonas sp. CAN1]